MIKQEYNRVMEITAYSNIRKKYKNIQNYSVLFELGIIMYTILYNKPSNASKQIQVLKPNKQMVLVQIQIKVNQFQSKISKISIDDLIAVSINCLSGDYCILQGACVPLDNSNRFAI
ncbi:hypothetical protein ABPG72_009931 [Tetrahymena utriculariae]